MTDREGLLSLFHAAIDAVHGGRSVERALADEGLPPGPVHLLGAGKAACAMAEGARRALGDRLCGGEVVVPDGHAFPVPGVRVREASHPLPDARSVEAARAALALASQLDPSQRLLVLLSGGASALWTLPVEGVSLEDLRRTVEQLLRSGADIEAINCVRKHLDRIKGGGLARASRAPLWTLAISDVAGDAPSVIGSGPTCGDPTTAGDALAVLAQYGLRTAVPASVVRALERGAPAAAPGGAATRYRVIASLSRALEVVRDRARELGWTTRSLGACLYGEARAEARRLAGALRELAPGVDLLVAGGEPVVHVRGDGRGGRAQELALAFALEIAGAPGVTALFAGTDGRDGPTPAAGAVVDGSTIARAHARGLDPRRHLERNDAFPLLAATGDLLQTGPTQTNVNDLALVRVRQPAPTGAGRGRPG